MTGVSVSRLATEYPEVALRRLGISGLSLAVDKTASEGLCVSADDLAGEKSSMFISLATWSVKGRLLFVAGNLCWFFFVKNPLENVMILDFSSLHNPQAGSIVVNSCWIQKL